MSCLIVLAVQVALTLCLVLEQSTRLPWKRSMASAATSRRLLLQPLSCGIKTAPGTRLRGTCLPRNGDRSSVTLIKKWKFPVGSSRNSPSEKLVSPSTIFTC
jgi:hypothetical protein